MKDIKNKGNNELIQIQKELSTKFEDVRKELIRIHDYWVSIEKEYNEVTNELNSRFGVDNK